MAAPSIFICHAQPDAAFAQDLALALETCRLSVWHDSRNLRGGDRLAPEIRWAIEQARQVIVVLGLSTGDPPWLRREVELAQEVERRRADSYRVIPLLLPGVDSAIPAHWFGPTPRSAPIELLSDGLGSVLPALLAALGEPPPAEAPSSRTPPPLAELELNFSRNESSPADSWRWTLHLNRRPKLNLAADVRTVSGRLPAPPSSAVQHWYLQNYPYWPTDTLSEFARRTEALWAKWGSSLHKALFSASGPREILAAWSNLSHSHERRLLIRTGAANPADAALLGLPWELLHDSAGFLIQAKQPTQFLRRLPGGGAAFLPSAPPLRVLAISPRPDTEPTGHPDHRRNTLPLLEALQHLGGLVEPQLLGSATLAALEKKLNEAWASGRPFVALHLDAYLRNDPGNNQILVGFEATHTTPTRIYRDADFITASALASVLATYRVRLVALSCRSNNLSGSLAAASLAPSLLAAGIAAVVTVHPDTPAETQQRFWSGFYEELLHSARISRALLAGQRRLTGDSYRAPGLGGNIHLLDWFCCNLYLGEQDPRLCLRPPLELWRRLLKRTWGEMPERFPPPPPAGFIGRSRALLIMERLLQDQSTLFVRGLSGSGKTTAAVALASWLMRCGRFPHIAYLNRDDASDPDVLLEALGRQLLPQGKHWSVDRYANLWQALHYLQQTLGNQPTLIVLDQLERWPSTYEEAFQKLWTELLAQSSEWRLLGLGRLGPPPFAQPWKEITLGPMDEHDAICLVRQSLIAARQIPPAADSGNSFRQLCDLVGLAGGHPAALQRIAHEIAAQGVGAALALLRPLRAELLSRHNDDRQWPLFLSLELGLRQLPPQDREHLAIIAFFKEGANRIALGKALLLNTQQLDTFVNRLLALKLVEDQGYGHLRFDTALSHYLAAQISSSQRLILRERWCSGMELLLEVLYQQYFKDKPRTTRLLRLELPNLMALLRDHQQHFSPERNARLASRLEQLTANLGVPTALTEIIAARERSSQALSGWSRVRFEIEQLRVERLRDNGLLEDAFQAARRLLHHSQEGGPDAYVGADYDLGRAHFQLGKLLKLAGAAQSAVHEFSTARQRFQTLADANNVNASRMAAVTDAEMGDCLLYLQRLPEAAAAYEAAIAHAGPRAMEPVIAANMLQLGLVRQRQGQYPEAVALCDSARRMFEGLGEPEGAARAWQQLASAQKLSGAIKAALHACQQALYLREQQRNREGITEILAELGHLYQMSEQLEEAAETYRRLAELCAQVRDSLAEEAARNKLANVLIQLHRHDEARQELYRASTCNLPDSYTARNWTIQRGLHDFGQTVQNPEVADRARRQAMQKYLAYRKAGGENDNPGAQLCAQVRQTIQASNTHALSARLNQVATNPNIPAIGKLLIAKLQAILAGSRDPALATDPELHYQYAVELQLLLEDLAAR